MDYSRFCVTVWCKMRQVTKEDGCFRTFSRDNRINRSINYMQSLMVAHFSRPRTRTILRGYCFWVRRRIVFCYRSRKSIWLNISWWFQRSGWNDHGKRCLIRRVGYRWRRSLIQRKCYKPMNGSGCWLLWNNVGCIWYNI